VGDRLEGPDERGEHSAGLRVHRHGVDGDRDLRSENGATIGIIGTTDLMCPLFLNPERVELFFSQLWIHRNLSQKLLFEMTVSA